VNRTKGRFARKIDQKLLARSLLLTTQDIDINWYARRCKAIETELPIYKEQRNVYSGLHALHM